jgi:hypothetical protein
MQFALHYRGPLCSTNTSSMSYDATRQNKPNILENQHDLRKHFHSQLVNLWSTDPVLSNEFKDKLYNFTTERKGGKFINLINRRLSLYGKLNILLLRPAPRGSIIQSGDLDNRFKTIFDALSMPTESQIESMRKDNIEKFNDTIYCVVEDDQLIQHSINLEDYQLLENVPDNEVELIIKIDLKCAKTTLNNLSLGS